MTSTLPPILAYLLDNPLTVFNSLLLIGTATLSYRSYVFQARAGIRESLEQLEDVYFRRSKLTAMLHEFSFLRSNTTVLLKYYQETDNPASSNLPTDLFNREGPWRQADEAGFTQGACYDAIRETVGNTEGVESSRVNRDGIILEISSRIAVEIRSIADKVLRDLREKTTRDPERFAENFGLDLQDESEPE